MVAEPEDKLIAEIKDALWRAIHSGNEDNTVEALEALIDAKLALAFEKMADRFGVVRNH